MIIRFIVKCLVVLFPWIALLACDNPGGALVALVMQVTVVGWPFAANWALKSMNETYFNPQDVKEDNPNE